MRGCRISPDNAGSSIDKYRITPLVILAAKRTSQQSIVPLLEGVPVRQQRTTDINVCEKPAMIEHYS